MAGNGEWNESLYGCFDDCGTCLYGWCCTPCLFGENAQKIDGSNCIVMCCAYSCLVECFLCWLPHYMKRTALRQKYGLREEPCGDCPVALCCGPCAICQEARFLKRQTNPGTFIGAMAPGPMPTTNQPRSQF